MAEIIKFHKRSDVETLLKDIADEEPEEAVCILFKDGYYDVWRTEVMSRSKFIGSLEIIKHAALENKDE